ncbi:hypothetical protein CFO_g3242 [Ceratocystis platani]|uniref:Uncharacterized protein n=1 Tax=Ceratocystis fimbriata f. sp. platani TaxID=88771 RepID=A0A0F8B0E9_CERFI|nr:hypothetical protein CFO_g3242 [Ceratocystis platani]
MAFSPKLKISTIYMAWTDEEPDHENKLSLTEIYNALAEKEGMKPDEMRWVTFEVVVGDFETDLLIDSIRQNRTLGSLEEVRILPGDKEWDMVAATQYYTNLLQVINKPVQKMLIRSINSGRPWEKVNYVNRMFFSFGPLEPKTPVPGTAAEVSATETKPESDEEEQEAALDALSAEEEAKENAF